MVCRLRSDSPDDPPLGCITGSGGFSRCLRDEGVLPSSTPPGTPVGGGLNPNAGPPGDDSHVEAPPQVLPDGGAIQGHCSRAEAIGNPIFAGTGNKYQEELDYSTPSGLRLARYYNSSLPGWTHSYGMRVLTRDGRAVAIRPTGRAYAFTGTGPGEWIGDPYVRDQLIRLDSNDPAVPTWRYVAADGGTEYYDAEGRVTRIVLRGGRTFTVHQEQGLLRSVTDPFGRSLQFEYDTENRLHRVRTPEGTSVLYIYDNLGRLRWVEYPIGGRSYLYENAAFPLALTGILAQGLHARWSYDAQGRAVLSERAGGAQRHQIAFSADGSIQVTDPLGTARVQRYGAAGAKQVFSGQSQPCASCIGDAADKILDLGSGLVLESRDFLGVTTAFSYDARKLPSSVTQAQGRPEQRDVQFEWHPTLRLPVRAIEPGRTTEYSYDSHGNTLSKTLIDTQTGEQRTWRWTYRPQGLVESMIDPRGAQCRYGHDAQGNRISVIDPLGNETRYTFDGVGNVLTEGSPARDIRSYTWDGRHRLIADARGSEITVYGYSNPTDGDLSSVAWSDGYRVDYAYDTAGRLVGSLDNLGTRIEYTLDAAGNRVREEIRDGTGQLAMVTGRVISSIGRVAALQGARGQTTTLGYDANGEAISVTDPLNHMTRQSLDGLRRVSATTFADNSATGQSWNALDQLTSVTDAKGVDTQYRYNAFGEVVSETSPDMGTLLYRRDAAGDVIRIEDAKGQVTTIDRDLLGRPREIRRADGETVFLQYSAAGDLMHVDDRSGSTQFKRDGNGRVTSKLQSINDNPSNPTRLSASYDYHQSKLIGLNYPSGMRLDYLRHAGRVVGIFATLPGSRPEPVFLLGDLTYTALGQPRSWRWSNGDEASRTFDTDGRMTRNEFAEYNHDSAGRTTGLSQKLWVRSSAEGGNHVTTTLSWVVGYDPRDRVIRFERPGASTGYTHDSNGNRLTSIETATSDIDLEGEFEASSLSRTTRQVLGIQPTSNRLIGLVQTTELNRGGSTVSTTSATVTYTLDANGSLTNDGLHEFEYDAANRLSRMRTAKTGEPVTVRYLHNSFGQRVFKSAPSPEVAIPTADRLGEGFVAWLKQRFDWLFAASGTDALLGTVYLYGDGELPIWALLGEYDNGSAAGRGRTEYIWLPLEDGSAVPVGLYRNGKLYAVHTDHLGTPRLVTDEERRPVWQWPYSAFGSNKPTGPLVQRASTPGEPPRLRRTEPIEFGLRFSGQHEDAEAGLSNNLFRWYHSVNGRYTQPDPIGLPGGLNRYGYVGGNPLSFMDPLGLQASPGAAQHRPLFPNLNPQIPHPPGAPIPAANQAVGATRDFMRNYSDLRDANTLGADKYFHCKANCEAASRGNVGDKTACLLSDAREWVDQYIKGDSTSASALDQAANTFGRSHAGTGGSCAAICSIYRPNGLSSQY